MSRFLPVPLPIVRVEQEVVEVPVEVPVEAVDATTPDEVTVADEVDARLAAPEQRVDLGDGVDVRLLSGSDRVGVGDDVEVESVAAAEDSVTVRERPSGDGLVPDELEVADRPSGSGRLRDRQEWADRNGPFDGAVGDDVAVADRPGNAHGTLSDVARVADDVAVDGVLPDDVVVADTNGPFAAAAADQLNVNDVPRGDGTLEELFGVADQLAPAAVAHHDTTVLDDLASVDSSAVATDTATFGEGPGNVIMSVEAQRVWGIEQGSDGFISLGTPGSTVTHQVRLSNNALSPNERAVVIAWPFHFRGLRAVAGDYVELRTFIDSANLGTGTVRMTFYLDEEGELPLSSTRGWDEVHAGGSFLGQIDVSVPAGNAQYVAPRFDFITATQIVELIPPGAWVYVVVKSRQTALSNGTFTLRSPTSGAGVGQRLFLVCERRT